MIGSGEQTAEFETSVCATFMSRVAEEPFFLFFPLLLAIICLNE